MTSAVAVAERDARYMSIVDVIQAQDNVEWLRELRTPDLLLIDWAGIQATGDDKVSRDQADLLGCLSRNAVGVVLEARHTDGRPTLLVADCDRNKLQSHLGKTRFEKLQQWQQIVDF